VIDRIEDVDRLKVPTIPAFLMCEIIKATHPGA
jgi:hypothetical protein